MNLRPIKQNMTELNLGNGTRVLFSYKTPVACITAEDDTAYKTDKFWSATTSRHINVWVSQFDIVDIKPQEYFDNLIQGVK
jgi:hypothetical protein